MCFTQVGSGLTHKHLTRLERLTKNKHSSLLRKSVNYGCKKFIVQAPGTSNKICEMIQKPKNWKTQKKLKQQNRLNLTRKQTTFGRKTFCRPTYNIERALLTKNLLSRINWIYHRRVFTKTFTITTIYNFYKQKILKNKFKMTNLGG
jgi:hypothetical protein